MSPPGDSRGRADAQLSRRPFPRGAGSGVGSQLCPSSNGPAKVTRPADSPLLTPGILTIKPEKREESRSSAFLRNMNLSFSSQTSSLHVIFYRDSEIDARFVTRSSVFPIIFSALCG